MGVVLGSWLSAFSTVDTIQPVDTVRHRLFLLEGDRVRVSVQVLPKERTSCLGGKVPYYPLPPRVALKSLEGEALDTLKFPSKKWGSLDARIPRDRVYVLEITSRANEWVAYRLNVWRKPKPAEGPAQTGKTRVVYGKYKPYTASEIDTSLVYAAGVAGAACCLLYLILLSE